MDGEAAARFAALVRQHLGGPVLCYEDRQSLLRAAAGLGIGRFDANLIIAAVQHRAEGEHVDVCGAGTGANPRRQADGGHRSRSSLPWR